MNAIKAKVMECTRKEYEGRSYFVLVVSGEGVPFGKVSAPKAYNPGSEVLLGIGRREADMKLVVRVVNE